MQQFIERKKDIFEPSVTAKKDYKNILMLAYYRNNLIHLFLNEAYISCALQAFGESSTLNQGITVQRLWEQTEFIVNILRDEFMVREQFTTFE